MGHHHGARLWGHWILVYFGHFAEDDVHLAETTPVRGFNDMLWIVEARHGHEGYDITTLLGSPSRMYLGLDWEYERNKGLCLESQIN